MVSTFGFTVRRRRARRALPLAVILLVAWLGALAAAQTVVVHPFGGQDLQVGSAVAERAAHALREVGLEVYGPEVAPTLVPPLVVEGGFINPAVFLGAEGIDGPTGAKLLRQTLGADVAVTGSLRLQEDRLSLVMHLSRSGEHDEVAHLEAPTGDPAALATRVARTIALSIGAPRPDPVASFDLTGPFGDYARAISLVGAGFLAEAESALSGVEGLPPEAEALLADLRAVSTGSDGDGGAAVAEGRDVVRTAVFSLASEDFREEATIARFRRFAQERSLPAATVWLGVLAASVNDASLAREAFATAADRYIYGEASQASYVLSRTGQLEGVESLIEEAAAAGDAAALLAASLVADAAIAGQLEKDALHALGRAAPFFTYPFEALSFIAFEEDDALAAAEALAVAVELDPASDLYWTNLGWAYYLLGFLDRSEDASRRAIEIDPGQHIARYNLGLAHAVRDDLERAMPQYEEALRLDPEVDDEAVRDLENALLEYSDAPSVHFALGFLYAAEGRRTAAAEQYRSYLLRAERAGTLVEPFATQARERLEALTAPPPPLEISPGASLVLGAAGVDAAPYRPGDPLRSTFELYTPGESLPQQVEVTYTILGPGGEEVASESSTVSVPQGAIGYVVSGPRFELPRDAAEGGYTLHIRAVAGEQSAEEEIPFEVQGRPQALRQLLGRGIVMQALASGRPLYGPADLDRPDRLVATLLQELRASAEAAEGAVPEIEAGPFAGLSGGEVFRESTEDHVRDFLDHLLAQGTRDTSFVFAEAYAQWAVEGAPSP